MTVTYFQRHTNSALDEDFVAFRCWFLLAGVNRPILAARFRDGTAAD
jgi:hypothetical protein